MRFINIFKSAWPVLLVLGMGLLWSCNVNETESTKSLNLTLYDSLSKDRNLYDSVRVDIQNGQGVVVIPAIFHGEYLKSRDSATLANLPLGTNPPNPLKVVITGYKGDKATLEVIINIKDKKSDVPIASILVDPVVIQPETTKVETKLPTHVVLSDSQFVLVVNDSGRRIFATLRPDSAVGSVTFTSSNKAIVDVDQEGKLLPLSEGNALITAHVTGNPAISDTVRITVLLPQAITSVTIQKPVAKLFVGGPATSLVLTHLPTDLTLIPEIKSSYDGIIQVIGGSIKAVSEGVAIVTANAAGLPNVKDTVHVQAVKDIPQIDAGFDQSVAVGQPVTFKVKVTQEYGTIALSWDFNGDLVPEGSATTDTATATYAYTTSADHNVVFTAKDGEGNISTLSRRIRVGKAGPLIIVTSPKRDTLVRTPKITIAYTVDALPTSKEFSLVEGPNNVIVAATNATGSDTVVVKVTLDTKAPVVKITSPVTGQVTNLPEIPVTWTADSIAQTTGNKESLVGKQGLIWIHRFLMDSAGNRGADSVQIVRDTIPPGAPTFVGLDTVTNSPRPRWTWTRGIGGNGTFVFQFGTAAEVITQDTTFLPTTDLDDANYTLRVRERDAAGNLSSWVTRTITVKRAGPGIPTFTSATTASPTNDKTPTWVWASSGIIGGGSGTFQWSINTTPPISGQGTATQYTPTADLFDGSYTLTLRESDALGNWSNPVTKEIRIQTQGALVEITLPRRKTLTNDRDGVIPVEWMVDKVQQTSLLTHALTTEGAWNLIRREYVDAAKNITFDTLSVYWDTTTPKVSFNTLKNGDIVNTQTITTAWSADAINQTTGISEALSPGDGVKTLTRTKTDSAGNVGTASVQVTLDMTKPGVAIDGQPTRTTNIAALTLTGTASDATSGIRSISVAGAATGNGAATFNATSGTWSKGSLTLAEGTNTLTVTATDNANLTQTATVIITLDSRKPSAPTWVSAPAASRTSTLTWTWAKANNDGNARFVVRRNSVETNVGTATTHSITATIDNTVYGLEVKEIDSVAGDGPWSSVRNILYDSQTPNPSISHNGSPTNTPRWNFTSSGGVGTFRYHYSGNPAGSAGSGASFFAPTNLSTGSHNLCVQEKDSPEWGEVWSTDKCATLTVDKTGPSVSITSPAPMGRVRRSVPEVSGTANDANGISRVEYSTNGTNWTPATLDAVNKTWKFTPTGLVYNQQYTISVRAYDTFDNVGSTATISLMLKQYVIFVRAGAIGGDGRSWETAFGTLDEALAGAASPYEIWMTEGTYSTQNSFEPYWYPKNSVSIYGGFRSEGDQSSITDRAFDTDKSVMESGFSDLDVPTQNVTIDGFHFSREFGFRFYQAFGLKIQNCRYNYTGTSSSEFIKISIGDVEIRNVNITNNTHYWGAIKLDGSATVDIYNTTIIGKPGTSSVGIHYQAGPSSILTLHNVTINGHTGFGQIYHDGEGALVIAGCTLTNVTSCGIEGGLNGIFRPE